MPDDAAYQEQGEAASGEIVLRLKRIEGQIRGLQRMVQEGRNCGAILTQLLAVRSSLDQVAVEMFNEQIERCLGPQRVTDPESWRTLQESLKLWARLR